MAYQPTLVNLLSESKNYELLLNAAARTFEPPVWQNYLTEKFQLTLDWRGILAVLANSPAASVIDFSSGKPLATRPAVSKINGELASLGNKYQMSKREVRELLELQDNLGKMGIDLTTIIDFLIPDIKRAATGPHKTIDRLLLEAMSTGVMTLTTANNPKGVIWNASLDWGVAHTHAAVAWDTSASATPLVDIQGKIITAQAAGYKFGIMHMSSVTFRKMIKTAEFLAAFKQQIGSATLVSNALIGLPTVNSLFSATGLPIIELMDQPIIIEAADGTQSIIMPFADNRVTFSVDNNFGSMLYTYANEQRRPVAGKMYSTANNVLISKFSDNDGNEFTESEFNAFPVLNAANSISILHTDTTS